MAKFTTRTPLSLLRSYKLSFLNVSLKISSLLNFAMKSPKIIYILYLWNSMNSCSNSSYKLWFEVNTFILSLGMQILYITPATISSIYDILSLTNSVFTAHSSLSILKNVTHLHIQCLSCST